MNLAKWQKIEELFNAAVELPREKQSAFLDSVCTDDELKNEVESLLENSGQEDSFLESNFSLGLAILSEEKKSLLIGKQIGRYKIIRLIGEGGMGEVYLAEDLQLNRQVALKLLPSYLLEDGESVARFQKEALAASSISHPNIAHIYEAGFEENFRFIAMEYVEGKTLRELITQKILDVITSLDIISQTANALVSAHQAGIIHRDIKPENIMIRSDGYVKVLDFGIAKLSEPSTSEQKINVSSKEKGRQTASQKLRATNTGTVMGTMGYISPEQLNNKNVDLRTDIWSLGVVLYEILSGNKPFKGKTPKEIRKAILRNKPPRFSVSAVDSGNEVVLQTILTKTLEKNAANRYQSARGLSRDLTELKQKLEFSQQFSTSEIIAERSSPNFGTIEQIQSTSFITKSKLFWNQQSISRKALLLAMCIGILTFSIGVSVQSFSRFYANKTSKIESFSPDSREKWQISTLFGVRRKLQGTIPSFSFSPDGKSIAFNMINEGIDNIYIKHLNQTEVIKITDGTGKYQTPIWSPDGNEIAFVTNRDNKNAIWTIPAQGGAPGFITNLAISTSQCELLKWSNDGERLFFKSGPLLKTIDLDTGQINEIKFPLERLSGAFSISQDESLIAFGSSEEEKQQLWVYDLKNHDLLEITEPGDFDLFPALLPDNKRLIFSSNQNGNYQLFITDFLSKNPTQITLGDSNASNPVISPDGKQIAYISEINTANIFSLELKTKKEGRITEATKMQLFPDVSKDGTNLVFQMTDDISNFESSPLRIKNLQTKREAVLERQNGFGAKWSPTKNEIAYLQLNGNSRDIWKIDLLNNQTNQITSGGIVMEGVANSPFNLVSFPFEWSHDGTKITFVSNQSQIANVCIINSDGTNLSQRTNNNDRKKKYFAPTWSFEGNKIAFSYRIETAPNKFQYGISIIADNQEKEVFQNEFRIRLLGWESNGTNLLTSVRNKEEVEIYEISDANEPKLLTKLNKAEFYGLSLSSDGKTIVYSANRNGIHNIFSYTINGKEKQITDNREDTILFSGISWSPAGDSIFYSKQSGGIQISMISDNSEKTE